MNQTVVHPSMKYYSASKKNERLIHATTWKDLKRNMVTEKKINSDAYTQYDSTYITFLK